MLELMRVYKDATSIPHGYLFIDLGQDTSELLRFRTNILEKEMTICYCSENLLNERDGLTIETIGEEQVYALGSP